MEPRADAQLTRLGRQVVRGDGVLEQRLDARDEDPRALPLRHAARAATRAAVSSATSSLRSYARAVRGSRTATAAGSPSQAPSSSATRSPISASRAIQTSGSPIAMARGEVRLGAVGHGDEAGVPARPARCRPGSRAVPAARRTCPSPRAAAAGRRGPAVDVHAPPAASPAVRAGGGDRRPSRAISRSGSLALRASSTSASTAAMSKSIGVLVPTRGVARREVGGDLFGDAAVAPAPAAQRRRGRFRHRPACPCAAGRDASRSSCGGRRSRPAARRPRPERRADPRRPRAAGTC